MRIKGTIVPARRKLKESEVCLECNVSLALKSLHSLRATVARPDSNRCTHPAASRGLLISPNFSKGCHVAADSLACSALLADHRRRTAVKSEARDDAELAHFTLLLSNGSGSAHGNKAQQIDSFVTHRIGDCPRQPTAKIICPSCISTFPWRDSGFEF